MSTTYKPWNRTTWTEANFKELENKHINEIISNKVKGELKKRKFNLLKNEGRDPTPQEYNSWDSELTEKFTGLYKTPSQGGRNKRKTRKASKKNKRKTRNRR